jgi:hypothetical protein
MKLFGALVRSNAYISRIPAQQFAIRLPDNRMRNAGLLPIYPTVVARTRMQRANDPFEPIQ